jgi:hypothetical protein
MRRTQRTLLILAGSVSLFVPNWLIAGGVSTRPEFATAGISEGLRRSPNVYIAAVLEVVAERECSDPKSTATCVEKVKLLEVLARHGTDVKAGDIIVFGNAGDVGSRYVAFLVPIKGHPNVYGATSLSIGASDDDRKRFVAELEAAGLKPGA